MTHPNSSDERELALRQAARRYADRKAKSPDAPQAQARQQTFRRFLADRGITRAELARMAGLPTGNALYNFTRGQSATLSLSTLEAIQSAIPGATIAEIIGERRPASLTQPAEAPAIRRGQALTVPLLCTTGVQPDGVELELTQLGVARAGVGDPAGSSASAIPVPQGIMPPTADLFAVRVIAPGAELLFPVGSLLICKVASGLDDDLPDGTVVILRCRANGSTRIDVREVGHFNAQIWLWQRSTHPEHQQPQASPRPLWGSHRASGGETITILGILVASCNQRRRPTWPNSNPHRDCPVGVCCVPRLLPRHPSRQQSGNAGFGPAGHIPGGR